MSQPAKQKRVSRKKAVKPEPEIVEAVKPDPEIVEVAPEPEVVEVEKKPKVGKKIKKQQTLIQINEDLSSIVESMQKDLESGKLDKQGEKVLKRHLKGIAQISSKADKLQKKPDAPKKTQSGFSKLCRITPALAQFAGWDMDQPRSRLEVNSLLCAYIRENGLQLEQDKRVIVPDTKLAALLNYKPSQGRLDFAELQKYISHLLVKIENESA